MTGACFQWAGKDAIAMVAKNHPTKRLMQSETECGSGENNWTYAEYTFGLFKWYFERGANSYMQWNMVLNQTGNSTWNWKQCSMINVDANSKVVTYNPQFLCAKHFSHFVKPGARRIKAGGAFSNCLAFKNKNSSIVVVANNNQTAQQSIALWCGGKSCSVTVPSKSFSTFVIGSGTGVFEGDKSSMSQVQDFNAVYRNRAINLVLPDAGAGELWVADASGRIILRSKMASGGKNISIRIPASFSSGWYCVTARQGANSRHAGVLIY